MTKDKEQPAPVAKPHEQEPVGCEGAIVNGRVYADRLEHDYKFECEAGPLHLCTDWVEFRRCFEWLAQHTSPPAQQPAQQEFALKEIEQYRLQMAGISTAAIGYWKEGDGIHPDYDTVALRDVAKLYAKYDELYREQPAQPQQEPVAWRIRCTEPLREWVLMYRHPPIKLQFSNMEIQPLYTSPPAQRQARSADTWVVPDLLTAHDPETLEYRNGWNDCRQLMMEMYRKEIT